MQQTWTMHFHGRDRRDTLADAKQFFLLNKQALGMSQAEFRARLLMNEAGTRASFVSSFCPLLAKRSGVSGERPTGVVFAPPTPFSEMPGNEKPARYS